MNLELKFSEFQYYLLIYYYIKIIVNLKSMIYLTYFFII